MIKKFIPSIIEKTIYDINFKELYDNNKRFILCDLDNTLIPYDLEYAEDDLKAKIKEIQDLGFTFIIVSNNHKGRVEKFSADLGLKCFHSALKPFKTGIKKALRYIKKNYYPNDKIKDIKKIVISLGDQLMTDIFASNNVGIDSILVHPLKKKSEKWYTKFNRKMEKFVLKRIKKKAYNVYEEIQLKHEY